MGKIILGYAESELKNIESDSIDLIFTSPPYAERRKNTYGGIPVDRYISWFLPIGKELFRVLKPTGSFFLNIKAHTHNGERLLYTYDLVKAIKNELGFRFIDDLCWVKNAYPGGYKGRFKNGFEPIYHFSKSHVSEITFNPYACGTPIKEESLKRAYRKQSGLPKNGSGMAGMKTQNIQKLKLARPSNVIVANNVSNQFMLKSEHSGTFPIKLVDFFVKSYSNENNVVLDPFAGSGTVGLSCNNNNRDYILIDKEFQNVKLMEKVLK